MLGRVARFSRIFTPHYPTHCSSFSPSSNSLSVPSSSIQQPTSLLDHLPSTRTRTISISFSLLISLLRLFSHSPKAQSSVMAYSRRSFLHLVSISNLAFLQTALHKIMQEKLILKFMSMRYFSSRRRHVELKGENINF